MSWSPKVGYWGTEDFSSPSGLVLDSFQTVTGGVLTLIPNQTSSTYYRGNWPLVENWTYENNLNTLGTIQSEFSFYTGAVYPGQTGKGSQRQIFAAGAWQITTPYPDGTSGNYFNQSKEALTLYSGSPFSGLYNYLDAGGNTFTIEFDVASTVNVSGQSGLAGFTGSGQVSLTGLPRLGGFINHGIYLDLFSNWDYLEITPQGIRSINHPEIAIPEDFSTVKRVRIGVQNQDLYISTESSKNVVGLGKIDASKLAADNSMGVTFGAPPLSGFNFSFYSGIDAIVGTSLWANIRVLTGELAITHPSGLSQSYTTTQQTAETTGFSPHIGLASLSHALIDFVPYRNGETTLYSRYYSEAITGWVDFSSVTLSDKTSPLYVDLNAFPLASYPDFENLISFKIVQESNGTGLPPVLNAISVYGNKNNSYLEVMPNWKPATHATKHKLRVKEKEFRNEDPYREVWSSFLLNSPLVTGNTNGFTDDIGNFITATGEIIRGGRFDTAFRNYTITSGVAISGSEAEAFFGRDIYVSNFFPNPFLEGEYRTITGESTYVDGRSIGNLAENLYIPSTYTGRSIVEYSKQRVARLDREAALNRINAYSNNSLEINNQYVQSVYMVANTSYGGTYDGTEGIEISVPSGIATPNCFFNFDLEVPKGDYLEIDVSGDVSSFNKLTLNGNLFRTYSNISVPINTQSSGEVRLIITVPSGKSSSNEYRFNLDNITVKPYSRSYIYCTGVNHYVHSTGIIETPALLGNTASSPNKAQTVFYGDYLLESYPESEGVLFESLNQSGRGFRLLTNTSGNLIIDYDLSYQVQASGLAGGLLPEVDQGRNRITYTGNLPLGRWFNLGFIHQIHNYNNMEHATYSAELYPYNFTACNKIYATVNGDVIVSEDVARDWEISAGDPAPFSKYISAGTGTVTAASGFFGAVDGLHFKRPPIADCEVELNVKGARYNEPYFVPDVFIKPNNIQETMLSGVTAVSFNVHIGSIYNLSNIGRPNWDHGPMSNHLLMYNSQIVEDSPYNLGSTYIPSTGEAISTYSSSFDRLFNTNIRTATTGFILSSAFNGGNLELIGWFKNNQTGIFFSMLEDINNKTGEAIHLINSDGYFKVGRYLANETYDWTATGFTCTTGEWNWFALRTRLVDYTGVGSQGAYQVSIKDISGEQYLTTGNGAGFRYYGKSGDTKSSCFRFGGYTDSYYCDWVVQCFDKSNIDFTYKSATGDKGGSYNEVVYADTKTLFTGEVLWNNFNEGIINLEASDRAREYPLTVSAFNNIYSNTPFNAGIQLITDNLFKEVEGYYLSYDESVIDRTFGSIVSPFIIGDSVPNNNINIAKIESPQYTVSAAINTYNLADSNKNNLAIYNNGKYSVYRNSGEITEYSGRSSLNSGSTEIYSGLSNIEFNDQAFTKDLNVTSLSIIDNRLDGPNEAYYYYLVGRGEFAVHIPDAFPHLTGEINDQSGIIANNYFLNREKIKNSIFFKDSAGTDIPFTNFPYDVYYSPYAFGSSLNEYLIDNDIRIDGLDSPSTTGMLPNGVFSVILVTTKKILNRESSIWAYYKGYDISSETYVGSRREIVNVSPIFTRSREEDLSSYRIELGSTNKLYDVFINGIANEYTGLF